mgnify:CR=1 FL=1
MSLSIFIRTDSSQKIGSGHVMRCLALSEELRDAGAVVEFVTHDHRGNINKQIKNKGFNVNLLSSQIKLKLSHKLTEYEQYLGITQEVDADKTIQILKSKEVDLLIIDHYALDIKWEERIRPYTRKVMVIDDLANRNHNCDLLLDQNYIYDKTRYNNILKSRTIKLLGPRYALLRRNFEENKKRHNINFNNIRRVFVFFGGVDLDNLTNVTLQALSQPKLKHLVADVVVGSSYPYKDKLKIEIDKHPNATLYTQIDNIAELMVKSDIAIGAGHKTHLHLLAVKRCLNAKIVVIMKPSLPLKLFDLCVIPQHDDVKSVSNVFITNTTLVNFNLNTKKKENTALFLIGGPSKHFYWNSKILLEQIKNISKNFKFKDLKKISVKTKIFPELIKDNFDFLNIDCEGNDFKILKTIDFKRYTPKIINIEVSLDYKKDIYNYMDLNGYKILDIKSLSHIFIKEN